MKSLNTTQLIQVLSLILLLVAPVAFYIWMFGGQFSVSHDAWGEFGSYLGGVYAPLIGFLTLIAIFRQVRLQKNFSEFERSERLIAGVRHDVEYLLDKLEKLIFEKILEINQGEHALESLFSDLRIFLTVDRSIFAQSDERLESLVDRYPNLLPMWSSITSLLYKIDMDPSPASKNELAFLEAKCVAVLTVNTCQALDQIMQHNMHSVVKKYYFLDECNRRLL